MFLCKIMLTAVKREIFSVLNLCFEAIVTSELNPVTLFTVAKGGMNNSCPCTIKLLILSTIFLRGTCSFEQSTLFGDSCTVLVIWLTQLRQCG